MGYVSQLNHIDIIIIVIVLFFGIRGFINGFAVSVISLAKYALSIFFTSMYYKQLAQYITSNSTMLEFLNRLSNKLFSNLPNSETVIANSDVVFSQAIAIVLLFIFTNMLVSLIASFIDGMLKIKSIGFLNKLAGFIFGAAKGIILIMLAFIIINPFAALNPEGGFTRSLNESLLTKYMYMYNFMFKYFNSLIEIFNSNQLG